MWFLHHKTCVGSIQKCQSFVNYQNKLKVIKSKVCKVEKIKMALGIVSDFSKHRAMLELYLFITKKV